MLYFVGTPIGNLADLSVRQMETLLNADIIAAEDTRSAGILIHQIRERYGPLINAATHDISFISYFKDNEMEHLPAVMNALENGKNVCVISQSGMPVISDPGSLLVNTVIKKNIPFSVIPGPTAFTTALAYSGFDPVNTLFVGFLPKKESHLVKAISSWQKAAEALGSLTIAAYESPNRINGTLSVIERLMPDTQICICRELTKKFEEIIRGSATELKLLTLKGEITLLLEMP